MSSQIYTVYDVKKLLRYFSDIFDIVRLVNPAERKIVAIDDDNFVYTEFYCHNVWNKTSRCDNCVSLRAYQENTRVTKYEFINQEVYNVVAKPITVIDNNGKQVTFVLELVNNISDEVLFDAFGREEFVEKITKVGMKVYIDSLTDTYNRRYYDEGLFCHNSKYDIGNRVAFIMVDIKKFKSINDDYGHSAGDYTLRRVGKVLKNNVRSSDSVIRIGGDEFLVILSDCEENLVRQKIDIIRAELSTIKYGDNCNAYVKGNLGYSYTDSFIDSRDFIEDMLKKADENMYLDKKATA